MSFGAQEKREKYSDFWELPENLFTYIQYFYFLQVVNIANTLVQAVHISDRLAKRAVGRRAEESNPGPWAFTPIDISFQAHTNSVWELLVQPYR